MGTHNGRVLNVSARAIYVADWSFFFSQLLSSTLSSLSLDIHLRLTLESRKSMTATSDLRQEARRFGFPWRFHLVHD